MHAKRTLLSLVLAVAFQPALAQDVIVLGDSLSDIGQQD